MYMHKHFYPLNFVFGTDYDAETGRFLVGNQELSLRIDTYAGDIYRLGVDGLEWSAPPTQTEFRFPRSAPPGAGDTTLDIAEDLTFSWRDNSGNILLESQPGQGVGFSGEASIFMFATAASPLFYGMGEKCGALERSNVRTKFWNTDVFGDFAEAVHAANQADPMYVSVPYLIVRSNNTYVGLLLDNACETFISTTDKTTIEGNVIESSQGGFHLGCANGRPVLYLIYGPSLRELTRKLQNLVGTTPLPPLWALGHHQCRWGYEDQDDIEYVDANYAANDIPLDGIWLDIDYMDGYRVFTFDREKFPSLEKVLDDMLARNRHVVPILDPGVKIDPGYTVYADGVRQDVFCKNAAGTDFVGIVWPGETVFPDFSRESARKWWADRVASFASRGLYGAWLDMNDPSTGTVNPEGMRFEGGKWPHYAFRNQYALGMARATRHGFLKAHPGHRPFLLCRSGFTGSSQYTAIWTGDNHSNYAHLRGSIPTSLNLSLSGIPFNGPDIGGFADDVTEPLMIHWQKAAFLFPVHRNHSIRESKPQEPWRFSASALKILRHYVRLRYRFLPYLYNLFIKQEEVGDPVLRPLFYEFEDTSRVQLGHIDDQFLVGPALMQAPVLGEEKERKAVLPPGAWYDYAEGKWIGGNCQMTVHDAPERTCLLGREGCLVPMRPQSSTETRTDLTDVELHVLLNRCSEVAVSEDYVCDDGESFRYREGARSRLSVDAHVRNEKLTIHITPTHSGAGPVRVRPVLYDTFQAVSVYVDGAVKPVRFRPAGTTFAGEEVTLYQGAEVLTVEAAGAD